MRDVFGVISIVIQNLPITQEDIEYNKKKWKILRLTLERLDVKVIAHGYNDSRKVTFRDKYCDNNNLDKEFSSSTLNILVNFQKSVFLPYFYVIAWYFQIKSYVSRRKHI